MTIHHMYQVVSETGRNSVKLLHTTHQTEEIEKRVLYDEAVLSISLVKQEASAPSESAMAASMHTLVFTLCALWFRVDSTVSKHRLNDGFRG